MNPITILVCTRMKELNLARKDMPSRLGYTNISKGMRKLEQFLEAAEPHQLIEEQLPSALELPEEIVREAIEKTRRLIKEAEEAARRAAFRPHLYVVTERDIPSQICICGMVGGHRYKIVKLPEDFNELPPERQDLLIRTGNNESIQRENGSMNFFGKILYYVLLRDYDEEVEDRLVYDTTGTEIMDPGEIRQRAPKNPPMLMLSLR